MCIRDSICASVPSSRRCRPAAAALVVRSVAAVSRSRIRAAYATRKDCRNALLRESRPEPALLSACVACTSSEV